MTQMGSGLCGQFCLSISLRFSFKKMSAIHFAKLSVMSNSSIDLMSFCKITSQYFCQVFDMLLECSTKVVIRLLDAWQLFDVIVIKICKRNNFIIWCVAVIYFEVNSVTDLLSSFFTSSAHCITDGNNACQN